MAWFNKPPPPPPSIIRSDCGSRKCMYQTCRTYQIITVPRYLKPTFAFTTFGVARHVDFLHSLQFIIRGGGSLFVLRKPVPCSDDGFA